MEQLQEQKRLENEFDASLMKLGILDSNERQ